MSDIAIRVEDLSKQYRLGLVGAKTLKDDIDRFIARIRGKEDPTLKIGQSNDRTKAAEGDYVWVLKDINFEVQQGDVVGIIGKNGAGKSTLLKIISKITAPTTGNIKIRGRIASLLEVGTGMHPELTGRENIFLNGAILGMTKAEIRRKLDEIIDFAGIAKYADTPIKRYSSGMQVRLGFAVAAFLEPEILIVDEVLAVGDAEFQKKAIGKMQDVSQSEGRTILFVSHNMNAVKHLCKTGILLKDGQIAFQGTADETVEKYLEVNFENSTSIIPEIKPSHNPDLLAQILRAAVVDESGNVKSEFDINDNIFIEIEYDIRVSRGGIAVAFVLFKNEDDIFRSFDTDTQPNLLERREIGRYKTKFKLPSILKAGNYRFIVHITMLGVEALDRMLDKEVSFQITEGSTDTNFKSYAEKRPSLVKVELDWNINKIN